LFYFVKLGADNPTYLKKGGQDKLLLGGLTVAITAGLAGALYGLGCMMFNTGKKSLLKEY
jgi:hypothetical protein